MAYTRVTVAPILFGLLTTLFISHGAVSQGFSGEYEVYQKDYNNDGYPDLYVREKQQILILHGDVPTPIVLPPSVKEFMMIQDGASSIFSVVTDVSGVDLSNWSEADAKLLVGDYNLDGILDAMFVGLVASGLSSFNQIVFSGEAAGDSPVHIRQIDAEFAQFFDEIYHALQDSDYYYNQMAINGWYEIETGSTYYAWWPVDYLFSFEYSIGGQGFLDHIDEAYDDTNSPYHCGVTLDCYFSSTYNVWYVWVQIEEAWIEWDWSHFNQEAGELFNVLQPITQGDGDIVETSPEAVIASQVLKTILQVPVFKDVLENGGIVLEGEAGMTLDERADDRFEALLWNVLSLWDREAAGEGSCPTQSDIDRVWGENPISLAAHYARNSYQSPVPFTNESEIPEVTLEYMGPGTSYTVGFLGPSDSPVHSIGQSWTNIEYRGIWNDFNPYKGWQLVYDNFGNLITEDRNMGTYDFARPMTRGHLRLDVTPWLEWGNTPDDTTTMEQRARELFDPSNYGAGGPAAVWYLKRFYSCTPYVQ